MGAVGNAKRFPSGCGKPIPFAVFQAGVDLTFATLADSCLASLSLRPTTARQWRGLVKNHLAPRFGRLKPAEIERKAIRDFIEKLGQGTPVLAARAFEVMRRIFSWAMEHEEIKGSPFVGLRKPEKVQDADSVERDRRLSRQEIHAVFSALQRPRFKLNGFDQYVRLLFEMAVRREELLKATWKEVDHGAKFFTIGTLRYKSKKPHQVPLTRAAEAAFLALKRQDSAKAHLAALVEQMRSADGHEREALESEADTLKKRIEEVATSPYVFPGPDTSRPRSSPQRVFGELRRQVGFEDWTLHDIRRTAANELDRLGVAPHIKEAILGHAPDKLMRTYSKHVPLPEMRRALEAWSEELGRIIEEAPSVHEFQTKTA